MAGYQVKLPVFEGPFDLLFHLIEEQKINIYDIPIATITAQYLDFLHMMEILDMDVASSFLVMAATLLEVKSRTLLPKTEPEPGFGDEEDGSFLDGSPEDARQNLVAKLLEYRRFKLVALQLREMERRSSRIFTRSLDYEPHPAEILQIQVGASELMNLFTGLIRRRIHPPFHKVVIDRISLNERISQVRQVMREQRDKISFSELIRLKKDKFDTILSFMAVLEMVKAGELVISQAGNFKPIFLTTKTAEERMEKATSSE